MNHLQEGKVEEAQQWTAKEEDIFRGENFKPP